MNHYVYLHYTDVDAEPFYVGIGSGSKYRRAYNFSGRTSIWKNIANKHGVKVVIHKDCLSKTEACSMEIEIIASLRARSVRLANISSGGEYGSLGVSIKGKKMPPRTDKFKAMMSERQKYNYSDGKHPMLGKTHTQQARENMRSAKMGSLNPMFGVKFSVEHRKKISDAHKKNTRTVSQLENLKPRPDLTTYKFKNDDGREFIGVRSEFIAQNNVTPQGAYAIIRGKSASYHGWRICREFVRDL